MFNRPCPWLLRPLAFRRECFHSFRHTEAPTIGIMKPKPAAYTVSPLIGKLRGSSVTTRARNVQQTSRPPSCAVAWCCVRPLLNRVNILRCSQGNQEQHTVMTPQRQQATDIVVCAGRPGKPVDRGGSSMYEKIVFSVHIPVDRDRKTYDYVSPGWG